MNAGTPMINQLFVDSLFSSTLRACCWLLLLAGISLPAHSELDGEMMFLRCEGELSSLHTSALDDQAFDGDSSGSRRVGSANASGFADAWERALELPDVCGRFSRLSEVGQKWFRDDPRSATHALLSDSEPAISLTGAGEILGGWMQLSPKTAFDLALQAIPPSEQRADIVGIALGEFAAHDPRTAIARVIHLEYDERQRALRALLWSWAFRDPEAAWRKATTLRGSFQPWPHIAEQWAARDPHSAFDTALNQLMTIPKDWLIPLFIDWSKVDVRSAANWAASSERHFDWDIKKEMMQVAIARLSVAFPGEVPHVLALADEKGTQSFSSLTATFWDQINQLIGETPQGLMDWYAMQSADLLRQHGAKRVARSLAETDLDVALNWAMELPAHEGLIAIGPVVGLINQTDPAYAEAVVLGFQDPSLLQAGAKSIVSSSVCPADPSSEDVRPSLDQITQSDLTGMREWVANNLPHEVRRAVYPLLFVCWSKVDLGGAANALADIEIDSERLSAALPLVFLIRGAQHEHEQDPSSNFVPSPEAGEIVHEQISGLFKDMDSLGAHILYSLYSKIDPRRAEGYREAHEIYVQREQEARLNLKRPPER